MADRIVSEEDGADGPQGLREEEERIRCFIALALSDEMRAALDDVARRLRSGLKGVKLRWVPPENLHLTLRFLGDVESSRIGALGASVAECLRPLPPFSCELGDVMLFPSHRKPRVIAVGLEPEKSLIALAEAVAEGLRAAGFPAEARRFRPHITLARFGRTGCRRPESQPSFDFLSATRVPRIGHVVTEVAFVRSRLQPTGAVYSTLGHFGLSEDPGLPLDAREEGGPQ